MPQNDLPGWLQMLSGLGLTGISTWFGRMMWHAEETRAGRRRFWSRDLALDLPVVAGMALVAWGAAEYLALGAGGSAAVGSVAGWLGPRGAKAALDGWTKLRGTP